MLGSASLAQVTKRSKACRISDSASVLFQSAARSPVDFGHFILKGVHGLAPFLVSRRLVFEKGFEDLHQLLRLRKIALHLLRAVLPQDRPLRGLEQNIVAGVALLKLLFDLLLQIVVAVFGLPIAVGQIKGIHQRAVGVNIFSPVSADIVRTGSSETLAAGPQQIRKSRRHTRPLMHIQQRKLLQFLVIRLNRRMIRFS